MKFTKIGSAEVKKTKKGKNALVLALDPKARARMLDHDFSEKIWIFKKKDNVNNDVYTVMSPMSDDYKIDYESMAQEWIKTFNEKHGNETDQQFTEWLEE